MTTSESLTVTPSTADSDEGIWKVRLDRDQARNALNTEIADALSQGIEEIVTAGGKLVVLEATGVVFSAGADLKEPASGASERAIQSIAGSPVPWLAIVHGPAIGAGAALVAVCTFSILGPDAWMSLPEVTSIDRFPVGVSAWLERFSGMRPLLEVGLSGRRISPEAAVQFGWASEAASDLQSAAARRLESLACLSAPVLAQAQQSWRRWLGTEAPQQVPA